VVDAQLDQVPTPREDNSPVDFADATFERTMEQVRNRVNFRLICDRNKLAKAVSRPTFRRAEILNDDQTMVRIARQRVTLNKPISIGFSVLEISKLIMY